MGGYAIFVGDRDDAADHDALRHNGVDSIVRVSQTPPETPPPDFVTDFECPLVDGPENDPDDFCDAVETLVALLSNDNRVLVQGDAGASRSVAVAAAGLALHTDRSFDDALDAIRGKRGAANPHPTMVEQGQAAVERLRGR